MFTSGGWRPLEGVETPSKDMTGIWIGLLNVYHPLDWPYSFFIHG